MIPFLAALHTPTLQFAALVVMAVTLLAVLGLWRASHGERYLRQWGIGYLLVCCGLVLSALRDFLPVEPVIIVSNVVMAGGGLLVMNGVALFVGRSHPRWLLFALLAGVGLAFLFFVLLMPSLRLRVAMMAMLFAGICLRMAWLLWRVVSPGLVVMQRTLAVLIGFQLIHYLAMATTALIPTGALQFSDAPAAHNAVYLNALIIFVLLLFGFTSLAHRRLQLRLEHAAFHDPLTGALNRRALDADLQRAVSRPPVSVLLLDLDHFKRLNDRFGHAVGDIALAAFAGLARERLRLGDLLGRVGGEEFCLVLPGTGGATAAVIAERLRLAAASLRLADAPEVRLSVSVGVAVVETGPPVTSAAVLKAADDALYAAKAAGRNCVVMVCMGDAGWQDPVLQERGDERGLVVN